MTQMFPPIKNGDESPFIKARICGDY